jgi:hypothetical protein
VCYSPDIIRIIKSRRRYGTRSGERKCIQRFGGETLKERDHLEDVSTDG